MKKQIAISLSLLVTLSSCGDNITLSDSSNSPSNAAPSASDAQYELSTEEFEQGITFPLNIKDPDHDPLTVTINSPLQFGEINVNEDNTITYLPFKGFRGKEKFSYTATDPSGAQAIGNVELSYYPQLITLESLDEEANQQAKFGYILLNSEPSVSVLGINIEYTGDMNGDGLAEFLIKDSPSATAFPPIIIHGRNLIRAPKIELGSFFNAGSPNNGYATKTGWDTYAINDINGDSLGDLFYKDSIIFGSSDLPTHIQLEQVPHSKIVNSAITSPSSQLDFHNGNCTDYSSNYSVITVSYLGGLSSPNLVWKDETGEYLVPVYDLNINNTYDIAASNVKKLQDGVCAFSSSTISSTPTFSTLGTKDNKLIELSENTATNTVEEVDSINFDVTNISELFDINQDGKRELIVISEDYLILTYADGRYGEVRLSKIGNIWHNKELYTGNEGVIIYSSSRSFKFYNGASSIGDVNADGYQDWAFSITPSNPSSDSTPSNRVIIMWGSEYDLPSVIDIDALTSKQESRFKYTQLVTAQANDTLSTGKVIKYLGDINGDNIDDFAVTTPGYKNYQPDGTLETLFSGRIWVFYGGEQW